MNCSTEETVKLFQTFQWNLSTILGGCKNNYYNFFQTIELVNKSGDAISWCFDVSGECKDLFERGIFAFIFKKSSSYCLKDLEENGQTIYLENGESYTLKVVFKQIELETKKQSMRLLL